MGCISISVWKIVSIIGGLKAGSGSGSWDAVSCPLLDDTEMQQVSGPS